MVGIPSSQHGANGNSGVAKARRTRSRRGYREKIPLRVLMVEDSVDDARLVALELERGGYETRCERVETAEAMREALDGEFWDLVIADHGMPRFSAPAALGILQEKGLDLPFIIVSGEIGEEEAVRAMKAGAHDYIMKGNLKRLGPAVERELREAGARQRYREAEEALRESEERYRTFLEQSAEAIWCFELEDPVPTSCPEEAQIERFYRHAYLAECNDAMARVYGYSRAKEIVGARLGDLLPSSVPENVEYLRAFVRSGYRLTDIESREADRRGNTRYFSNNLTGIVKDGFLVRAWGTQRDVTERKRAEEALKESEERFRSLVRNASDMIVVLDADGTITYESPAVERILGYRPEERIGTCAFDHLHPDDAGPVRSRFDELLEKPDERLSAEYRVRDKEGSWRHFEVIGANMLHDPSIGGIVINARDITERKRTEEELTRLASFPLLNPNPVFETSPTGEPIYLNPTAERLFPDARRLGGRHPMLADLETAVSELRRTGARQYGREVRFGERYYQQAISPIPGSDLVRVYALDVTERHLAEEELRISEERFRATIEQSPLSVQIFSPDGRTLRVNRAWEELWGVTLDDVEGYNILEDRQLADKGIMPHILRGFAGESIQIPPIKYEPGVTIPGLSRHEQPERWVRAFVYPIKDERGNIREVVLMHEDITERRLAEEELRESEERYRVVTETASDAIVLIDEDSWILFVNDAAEKVFGYAREEMLGQQLTMLMPEELREAHRTALRRYLDTEERRLDWDSIELPGMHKSGREIPLEVSFGEYVKGGEHFFTGFIRDITERKRAEETLKTHSRVLESMVEGVSISDENGYILYTNPSEDAIFGYEPGELVGQHVTVQNTYSPEENARIVSEVIEQLNTRGVWSGEFSNRKKDGSKFTTFARITALQISGKKHWVCVQEDITERRQAEEALRESHALLHSVIEGTTDPIYVKDLRGRYLLANAATARTIGGPVEEILDKDDAELLPPEVARPLIEIDRRVMDTTETHTLEEDVTVEGDTRTFLSTKTVFWNHRGETAGIIGVSTDITERKRAEEQVREIKESERRRIAAELHDEVLQDLVYGLQETQIMQVTAARDEQGGESELFNSLEAISEALRRAVEGLREAIFELRLDETLERSVVSSVESLAELNRRMSRKQYEVHLSVEGLPKKLPTDTGRGLVGIVREALNNARRHSSARNIWITLKMEGDYVVRAEVADDGCGFDAKSAQVGVGTSVMRQRALDLGGEIEIESEPGAGTVVCFRGPADRLLKDRPGGATK